jgi:hypothetical protein
VHDGHGAAEAAKHLAELEANVATAENQEMLRQFAQLHQGLVGQIADRIEAGKIRRIRACAGIDEDALALQDVFIDFNLVRRPKMCAAAIEAQAGMLDDIPLLIAAESQHDSILSVHHKGKVHFNAAGADAPTRSVPRVMRDLRGSDHRFRGRAAGVNAGAAEVRFLDESNGPAAFSEGIGKRIARLSGADDDGVVLFHVRMMADTLRLGSEANRPY